MRSPRRQRTPCECRVTLRDAMVPLLADGWRVTDADRVARTYTLSR